MNNLYKLQDPSLIKDSPSINVDNVLDAPSSFYKLIKLENKNFKK